jgi:glycosyltransferase involved in cell wall biosynthesis
LPSSRRIGRIRGTAIIAQNEPPQPATLLTVLVPCFNEAAILQETVAQLTAYLDAGSWREGLAAEGDWEILLVDDGSTDGSRTLLAEITRSDNRVRYLSYRTNAGQGQALQKGFAAAQGDWIFCVDADLDYGPEHIERFLALAQASAAEIVVGSPYMSGGMTSGVPLTRLFMSRLMNWYFRKVLNLGFSTYTSILRLYRREVIQALLLTSRDKELLPEIVIKASLLGISIIEAPAHLHWKARRRQRGRHGVGVLTTARKAMRHLLWGAMENPMLFFLGPALVVSAGTVWFAIAIAILFFSSYSRAAIGGLQGITFAANNVIQTSPQTIAMFIVLLLAALILFSLGIIILQNKVKREHDFVYFSRLLR